LHVGLGRRPPVHLRVRVDEREVLALGVGELGAAITIGHRHDRPIRIRFPPRRKEERMNERYVVELTDEERDSLKHLVSGGSKLVRDVKRAQVLLAADAGLTDEQIALGERRNIDRLPLCFDESPVQSSARLASRSPPSPASQHGSTASTGATGPRSCSCSSEGGRP
jgi:hypothetical protein